MVGALLGCAAIAATGAITSAGLAFKSSSDTNEANLLQSNIANSFNKQLQDEQNQWNREQWELENDYNSPVNQVDRLTKAGINPLWSMSGGNPGTAQQLTSAPAQPAVVPSIRPELFDISGISQIANSMLNAFLQSEELGIKQQEADTHSSVGQSTVSLNEAKAKEAAANSSYIALRTQWDLESFDLRLDQAAQTLENLYKEGDKLDADTEASKAKKLEIVENTKLISERINEVREGIRQRDEQLRINLFNAATNRKAVQVELSKLDLEQKKFKAQCQKWDNDTLMQYMYKFGRTVNGKIGAEAHGSYNSNVTVGGPGGFGFGASSGFEVGGSVSGQVGAQQTLPAQVEEIASYGIKLTAIADELTERSAANPTPENLRQSSQAVEACLQVQSYMEGVFQSYDNSTPSNTNGLINPVDAPESFGSWSSWQ